MVCGDKNIIYFLIPIFTCIKAKKNANKKNQGIGTMTLCITIVLPIHIKLTY